MVPLLDSSDARLSAWVGVSFEIKNQAIGQVHPDCDPSRCLPHYFASGKGHDSFQRVQAVMGQDRGEGWIDEEGFIHIDLRGVHASCTVGTPVWGTRIRVCRGPIAGRTTRALG